MSVVGVHRDLCVFGMLNTRENACLCSARINKTEATTEKSPKDYALKHCISFFFLQYSTFAALEGCLAPFELIDLSS